MWLGLSAFVVLAVVAAFVVTSMWFGDRTESTQDPDDGAPDAG